MMQVEEKPDVTYDDIGGCKEQIDKLREVVELPLLNVSRASPSRALTLILIPQPERFVELGIDPPKGVMLYGTSFLLPCFNAV
jgi:26S proteasome regulatory subunit T1